MAGPSLPCCFYIDLMLYFQLVLILPRRWEQDSDFLLHKKESHLFRDKNINNINNKSRKFIVKLFNFKLIVKNPHLMTKIIVPSSKLSAFLKPFGGGSSDKWQQTLCTSNGEENSLNLTADTLCTVSFEVNTYGIRRPSTGLFKDLKDSQTLQQIFS